MAGNISTNVLLDYDWTVSPRRSPFRKSAPRVWVRSFKINSNEALNRLKSYLEISSVTDVDTFYKNLYGSISEPEDVFIFPYFSDGIRSFSNTYGDTFQSGFLGGLDQTMGSATRAIGELGNMANSAGGTNFNTVGSNFMEGASNAHTGGMTGMNELRQLMGGMGGALNSMGGGNPGSYIETPKMYQYEQNDSALEVSFVLANTINSDSWRDNTDLVKKLTRINRPRRIDSIAMEPPRIFNVKIPGQRFIKWAYCSSFSSSMIGVKREIGGQVIPEGYMVSMSFTSLTTEVSNFMDNV